MTRKLNLLAPISEILRAYWKADCWTLLIVAIVVLLSSVSSVAAPYLFSRLIDRLPQDGALTALAWGFVIYAVLLGAASALQHMVQYLSFMSAENLGFIAATRFFERILNKTAAFFVEHNPAEIQNASSRGRGALTTLVQLGLIVFIPGATQILLTLATLGALVNIEVAAIVVIYGIGAVTLTVIATVVPGSFSTRPSRLARRMHASSATP
jgi:ABC-type multidrug transport system fused ATPase/permease subunit